MLLVIKGSLRRFCRTLLARFYFRKAESERRLGFVRMAHITATVFLRSSHRLVGRRCPVTRDRFGITECGFLHGLDPVDRLYPRSAHNLKEPVPPFAGLRLPDRYLPCFLPFPCFAGAGFTRTSSIGLRFNMYCCPIDRMLKTK